MYLIIEGEFSDWEPIGYVETEEEAMNICATHNAEEDDIYVHYQWYFKEIKPMAETPLLQKGFYEYEVVFNPDREFLRVDRRSMFPTVRKEPKIIQEDKYCYVIRVTSSKEKAMKIAKDFLMRTLAERAGIC